MRPCFSQHWDADYPRFVYGNEVKAEVTVGGENEPLPPVPEVAYDPSKRTANEQWATIDEKYGQSPYQDIILNYAEKLLPNGPADYRMALVLDSTNRYMQFYTVKKREFMQKSVRLQEDFESRVEAIQKQTKKELHLLRSAVEGSRPLTGFNESMPSLQDGDAVIGHFENYLDALNGRYFNADVNFSSSRGPAVGSGIPLAGRVVAPETWKYEEESQRFQIVMKNWVEAKVTWLLKQNGTTPSTLEDFKKEIAARYDEYSKYDTSSSIISSYDLAALEDASKPPPDAVGRILDESDDKALKRLEIMQIMNPSGWEDTIEMAGTVIIRGAENGNLESEFIAEVSKYQTVEGADDKEKFEDAKDKFKDMLEEISRVGVRETLDFLRNFNVGVHNDVLKYEKEVRPPALAMQVGKQMDYLLGGVLVPQQETDRMLVRFMRADRDARDEILQNDGTRNTLFRAIKQATTDYPAIYDQKYSNIPDDVTKLRRSANIEKPTTHDQAAQLQALIIIGNQAKVIVSKLNRAPEYAGRNLEEEISNTATPPDSSVVMTGLRFRVPGGDTPRFRSAIDRGGFNSRDLALKGAKVLGCLVILSNVARSFSETHGDFVDRVLDTVERSATNQGVLIGAAVTVGSHMAERDKRFLRYPWLSQHEQAATMTAFKLDNIAARVGRDEASRFLYNNAEWRALAEPAMDPSQIKELLQNANKEAPKGSHPIITVEDMRKVVKDESIIATLSVGGRSARMRYLFYQKFFATAVKPDVNHTKELCTGAGYIASSPYEAKKKS